MSWASRQGLAIQQDEVDERLHRALVVATQLFDGVLVPEVDAVAIRVVPFEDMLAEEQLKLGPAAEIHQRRHRRDGDDVGVARGKQQAHGPAHRLPRHEHLAAFALELIELRLGAVDPLGPAGGEEVLGGGPATDQQGTVHPEAVGGEMLAETAHLRWGAAEAVNQEDAAVAGAELERLRVAGLRRVAEDPLTSTRHARILT